MRWFSWFRRDATAPTPVEGQKMQPHPISINESPQSNKAALRSASRLMRLFMAQDKDSSRKAEFSDEISLHKAKLSIAGHISPSNSEQAESLVEDLKRGTK